MQCLCTRRICKPVLGKANQQIGKSGKVDDPRGTAVTNKQQGTDGTRFHLRMRWQAGSNREKLSVKESESESILSEYIFKMWGTEWLELLWQKSLSTLSTSSAKALSTLLLWKIEKQGDYKTPLVKEPAFVLWLSIGRFLGLSPKEGCWRLPILFTLVQFDSTDSTVW